MNIDYCKIVEDLIPLYCDDLVSQETREFIEGHLSKCTSCREKYEDSSDRVLFSNIDTVEEWEDDKFKSARGFILRVKKFMYKVGLFTLMIIILVGAGGYLYGSRLNNDFPIQVKSGDDLANRIVPGWERAQKLGQVIDIGISKPIQGTSAVVTFDKVWYTPSRTYVLYTVKEPHKKYLMAFNKDIDIAPDRNMKNNPSMEPLSQRWGGISPEGYHQVMVFLGYNTPVPSNKLTLTASGWRRPPSLLGTNSTNSGVEGSVSVKLPLLNEYLTQKSEMIALEKNYEWEGRNLHIKGLDVGSAKTLLYGEAILKNGETLNHIEGVIKCGGQSAGLNYESIVPGDAPNSFKFVFYADPLSQWPGKITLNITALRFKSHEVLKFPVDWSLYAGKRGRINVPSGKDSTVSFYDSTIRLWTVDPEKGIDLEIVEPSQKFGGNKPYITMSSEPIMADLLNKNPGLKVTNENGSLLEVSGAWGGNINGNSKVGVGFGIDSGDELWKSSKKINIIINKPNARLVVNQKIEIK